MVKYKNLSIKEELENARKRVYNSPKEIKKRKADKLVKEIMERSTDE